MYRHPQGSIAVVHPDGSVEKFTSTGVRNPKTSATAEKLAAGHGRWERISNATPGVPPEQAHRAVVPTPSVPEPERKSIPAPPGTRYRKPMDFNEAPVEDIPKYAADPEWHFQQKVDGVRAQLVVEPGKKPWFRSKAGEQLQSTTAAPVTRAILDHIGTPSGDGPGYTVDGEVVDGRWHVFDMSVNGDERVPWETRMDRAKEWASQIGSPRVSALPVAKTEIEKQALAHAIRANGGEGVMMKRRGSSYDYGSRVSHSLKAKYVSTADVIVTKLRPDGKDSAEISAHDENGVLRRIGTVPLGGKEKAGKVNEGDVIEVNYLYAMPGSDNLVQARMVKLRPDKKPSEATTKQLRRVSKEVLDERAMKKQELRARVDTAGGGAPPMVVKDYEGEVGNSDHITRNETGQLPIGAVAQMPGARGEVPGEHRNRTGQAWEDFKADVAANGIRNPVFITVDHGKGPVISEGSHRRDAAVELGMTHVPAEIRYFGHAEHQGTVEERAGVHRSEARARAEAAHTLPPSQASGKLGSVEPDYYWPSDGKATPERVEGRRRIDDALRLSGRADAATTDALRSRTPADYARAAALDEQAANALDGVPGYRDKAKQLREDAAYLRAKGGT